MQGAPQPAVDALAQPLGRFVEAESRVRFELHECATAGAWIDGE